MECWKWKRTVPVLVAKVWENEWICHHRASKRKKSRRHGWRGRRRELVTNLRQIASCSTFRWLNYNLYWYFRLFQSYLLFAPSPSSFGTCGTWALAVLVRETEVLTWQSLEYITSDRTGQIPRQNHGIWNIQDTKRKQTTELFCHAKLWWCHWKIWTKEKCPGSDSRHESQRQVVFVPPPSLVTRMWMKWHAIG